MQHRLIYAEQTRLALTPQCDPPRVLTPRLARWLLALSLAALTAGACARAGAPEPTCGDAALDPGEVCDDGNTDACDGCSATCVSEERCGDGIVECDEECDDGNTVAGDGCSPGCTFEPVPMCGNGTVETTESCDDGNNEDCDGCTPTCQIAECGNGVLDCREECDDGNTVDGDGCQADCNIVIPSGCGNGTVDPGEECDDGNNDSGDSCQPNCMLPACGDGFDDPGEECDDGNGDDGDGCSAICTVSPYTHTIVIDGNNDFGAQDVFSTSTLGFSSYIAWDANDLFIGLNGTDVASGDPNKWIVVYLGGASGAQTGATYNTQTPALPFTAGYHLRWKADGNYIDLQGFDGDEWISVSYTGRWERAGSYVELAIPLVDIGDPGTVEVHISMINEQPLAEWSWSAVPESSFMDGYNPGYNRYYAFDRHSPAMPNTYASLP